MKTYVHYYGGDVLVRAARIDNAAPNTLILDDNTVFLIPDEMKATIKGLVEGHFLVETVFDVDQEPTQWIMPSKEFEETFRLVK